MVEAATALNDIDGNGVPCGGAFVGLGVHQACRGLASNQMYPHGVCPSCEFDEAQAAREGGERWKRDQDLLARMGLTQHDVLWVRLMLQPGPENFAGKQTTMHCRNVVAAMLRVMETTPRTVAQDDVRDLMRAVLRGKT